MDVWMDGWLQEGNRSSRDGLGSGLRSSCCAFIPLCTQMVCRYLHPSWSRFSRQATYQKTSLDVNLCRGSDTSKSAALEGDVSQRTL
mmetsp:Transcript_15493/g.30016  ORF Transcript_15493/g.30016 Transcript_15493/m.30016 type:complete len:87 (-) Transcript_15493:735-995(-)